MGNTFGATALSSYGGFWIALAITLTPGGFAIISTIEAEQGPSAFYDSFSFFIFVSNFPPSLLVFEKHPPPGPLLLVAPAEPADLKTQSNAPLGLVHIHNAPPYCHAPLHRRIFLHLLHPRHRILTARDRILAPGCQRGSKYTHNQNSWLL